ncbi:MAG TPA: ChbG/HpnK family deacetylase [Symbiobacteriaceae bacterium]
MERYLIVNGDDFGLSEAVSRGILQAHREGILTSTTFLVNLPRAEEMAALLRDAPDLGVGIHLNLTTGTPVLPPREVPTLVNAEGRFSKALLHLRFRVDPEEARKEWCAQVERGIQLLGRLPTHLDTHHYLQGYPGFAEVMVAVARTYGIPAVRCLYPDTAPAGTFARWTGAGLIVDRYIRRSCQVIKESGLRCPDATRAGDFDLPGLLRRLEHLPAGVTELICHPGRVDDQLRSLSSLQAQREVELAALTAPETQRAIREYGIRLISFRDLATTSQG